MTPYRILGLALAFLLLSRGALCAIDVQVHAACTLSGGKNMTSKH